MRFSVAIDVMPRSEISDPQGQTIERALPSRGFKGIEKMRVGKKLTFELAAEDEQAAAKLVQQACESILTNPIVEEFSFQISRKEDAKT